MSHGDRDPVHTVYLHGGQIFTSTEPAVVTTIVGLFPAPGSVTGMLDVLRKRAGGKLM